MEFNQALNEILLEKWNIKHRILDANEKGYINGLECRQCFEKSGSINIHYPQKMNCFSKDCSGISYKNCFPRAYGEAKEKIKKYYEQDHKIIAEDFLNSRGLKKHEFESLGGELGSIVAQKIAYPALLMKLEDGKYEWNRIAYTNSNLLPKDQR